MKIFLLFFSEKKSNIRSQFYLYKHKYYLYMSEYLKKATQWKSPNENHFFLSTLKTMDVISLKIIKPEGIPFSIKGHRFLLKRLNDDEQIYQVLFQSHFRQNICKSGTEEASRFLIEEIEVVIDKYISMVDTFAMAKITSIDTDELIGVYLFNRKPEKFSLAYSVIFDDIFIIDYKNGEDINVVHQLMWENVKKIMSEYGSRKRTIENKNDYSDEYGSLCHYIDTIYRIRNPVPKKLSYSSCPNSKDNIDCINTSSSDIISSSLSTDSLEISPRIEPSPRPRSLESIPKRPKPKFVSQNLGKSCSLKITKTIKTNSQ